MINNIRIRLARLFVPEGFTIEPQVRLSTPQITVTGEYAPAPITSYDISTDHPPTVWVDYGRDSSGYNRLT